MPSIEFIVIWVLAAYLAGSIPFGLLIGLAKGVDIRKQGSGNVGATNAGRVLGKRWGILCFLLDVAKGFGPVFLFGWTAGLVQSGQQTNVGAVVFWLILAAVAVLGHVFPVWLKFKGGKGVATGLGVLLGLWPVLTVPGLLAALVWFLVVKTTGYVSLASITAAIVLPVLTAASAWAWDRPLREVLIYVGITAVLALLVVLRHRSNITRLRAGTESKVGWTKGKSAGQG